MTVISGSISFWVALLPVLTTIFSTIASAKPLEKRTVPPDSAKPGFKKVWWEDFTHKDGLNYNWLFDVGTSYPGQVAQWGTGEIQTYTKNTENIKISNGILSITPRKKVSGGKTKWTSARIESNKKNEFACPDGKKMVVEASIKLGSAKETQQKGIWPAFWMLGTRFRDLGYKGWPEVGEWDIMESVNGLRKTWGLIHCGMYNAQRGIKGPCNENNGLGAAIPGVSRGVWNTFGFEVDRSSRNWRTEKLTWIVNGSRRHSITGAQVNNQTAWDFLVHKKFFILLNVAVGGGFPNGVEGKSTPYSTTIDGDAVGMQVDWVAVWQQK
ncbi:Beta-glucanase [Dactylella cylindrospora]|nr:Beta-glucanase [Dactylella cylindrospora]